MSEQNLFLVESSPQIRHRDSTSSIMWQVSIALMPAGIWGIWVFGIRSLLVIAVSIASAVGFEYLAARSMKRSTVSDGSAFLTGLLIGYNMPPLVPLFIPVAASAFAILVVKWAFGGLGANWMNPALAGRVFVFFSWTSGMNAWKLPRTIQAADGVSSATVLGSLKTLLMDFSGEASSAVGMLRYHEYPASAIGQQISSWFDRVMQMRISAYTVDLAVGNVPGSIGEVSAVLLIIGGIYLLAKNIITWEIPVTYILSFALLIWAFDGLRFGQGLFSGDAAFHVLSGGLMLGALFMATDMVTSPVTRKGMIVYGIGAGMLTFLIRVYGSLPEGVSMAIIIMNIFVPMINRYMQPKVYGTAARRGSA